VLTCVYCGTEYPQNTPAWGSQILTDHIKICPKHPMRNLEVANANLRSALVGLVGVDGDQLHLMLRLTLQLYVADPDEGKAALINAVHALIDTLPTKPEANECG